MDTNKSYERQVAEFLFGMCDQSVTSEFPEEDQLNYLTNNIIQLKDMNPTIYYYLSSAYENSANFSREE